MKKILYIVTQSEFGGAQRYVFDLVNNFKNDFEIIVASENNPLSGNLLSRCSEIGIETHRFKFLAREINLGNDFKAMLEISDYIKQEKPDIVHLNSAKAGVLGTLAAQFLGKEKPKIIYTVHGWAFLEPISKIKRLIYLWAEKFTGRFRDALIVLSEKEKSITLEKRLSHPSKISVIPHGIDYSTVSFYIKEKARNTLNLKPDNFVVGTVANLYPTKGLEYLIEAAKTLDNVVFVVIGEGQERKKLESLIKSYNLENRFFLVGAIPEAYKLFWAFDIFVLPSVKEGMPYVILEAMAAGRPIVATQVGAIPKMLQNGISGTLIQPQNPIAIKNAILELLQNPSKRNTLGFQAQKRLIENYSTRKMLEKTGYLYNFSQTT
ncbi:MAG: glycosyltransferase family 4 protein [Patescibacteria group bacterium]|nr:glycosyltransferase family 4 protein [Patescibacteria group bacterium]